MARDYNIKTSAVDPSKYVYRQERDITKTDVDWTKVTKDLTTTIETIRDDRETRKAEIEEATTTAINDMAEMEQYDSESLNVKVLEGSQWGSEFLASQNALMKRGYLKPADFMVSKQKVQDSFSQLKTALGTFDKAYIEGQKRMNSEVEGEQSTTFEQGLLLRMGGLAGLSQWDFSGNPATGAMAFVKKGEDASNPANVMSLNVINQRLNQKSNYVSLSTSAADIVSTLGEEIKASFIADGQRGAILTTEDWLKKKGSKEMLATLVKQATATQNKRLSILQDVGVTAEMYTSDPKVAADNPGDGTVANPGYVLMVPVEDGQGTMTVQLTDLQKDLVDKEAEKVIKSQLDKKNEITGRLGTTYAPQDTNTTVGKTKEEVIAAGYMKDIIDLTEGDEETAKSAADALASTINKSLGPDDPPITLLERVVDAAGATLAFQIHRQGINTVTVDVADMSPENAQRALYENVTPTGVLGYHEAVKVWGGTSGDEYGEGGVQGRGPTKQFTTLDFERSLEIPGSSTAMTAYEYVDSKLGEFFGAGNSYDEAIDAYKTVLSAMMPADLFDAVGGSENIEVSFQGNTLIVSVGAGADRVYRTVTNSSGENDSTRLHLDVIEEVIIKAREKAVARKTGTSSQSSFDDWLVANPNGSFADWLATQ